MIRLKNVRVKISENIDLKMVASKKLGVKKEQIKEVLIHKKSIDARKRNLFSYVFDLDVSILDEDKYLTDDVIKVCDEEYVLPKQGNYLIDKNVVVVGSGPAGLFASFMLAK